MNASKTAKDYGLTEYNSKLMHMKTHLLAHLHTMTTILSSKMRKLANLPRLLCPIVTYGTSLNELDTQSLRKSCAFMQSANMAITHGDHITTWPYLAMNLVGTDKPVKTDTLRENHVAPRVIYSSKNGEKEE